MFIFSILAILSYLATLGLIIPSLLKKNGHSQKLALVAATIALVFHAIALQQRIFNVADGQNLNLLNIALSVSLIISIIMTFVASRTHSWLLLPVVYSFSVITLALAGFMPWEVITHLEDRPSLLLHITLALFAYATLCIAALYAIQLAWIDFKLKHKTLSFTVDMPPLMTIERKLFHITQVGFVLLTLTLCTGFIYLDEVFSVENRHKAILSIIAWFVYAALLWGHFQRGWRGKRIIWFSLIGTVLLTLAYFGSRLIQFLIYH